MPVKMFFCYAHEDEALLKKLKTHLKLLQRQHLIDIWHDRDISAGTEWEREISHHLNTAQVILLLISPDFMDSDYCYGVEMKRAIERHERGEALVIPIILRYVYWQGEPHGKLQVLPTDAKPVTSSRWHDLDEAFFNVVEGIRNVIERLLVQQAKALGDAYASTEHYSEALASYEDAIRFNPNDAGAYISKGIVLVVLHKNEEALVAFEQAICLDPNSARGYNNKGSALGNLKRYREALAVFEQATLLDPNNTQIYINKGRVLDELKRYREALAAFEQAVLLDPNLRTPKIHYIKWAKELLSMPNLAFLEVETTGLREDDEIIRVLLVNRNGDSIFDIFVCPDKAISDEISRITGIFDNELELERTITETWKQISDALTRKYLLSFNLEFDQRMLEAVAKRYELEMPLICGECLMQKAMMYSGSHSYAKLSNLCAYIGHPLPEYPHQTALDRARGQIALLKAISQGIIIEEELDYS